MGDESDLPSTGDDARIRVVVRVRPVAARENEDPSIALTIHDNTTLEVKQPAVCVASSN
jgi:hypothetical protein